jgi:hypothetical protein
MSARAEAIYAVLEILAAHHWPLGGAFDDFWDELVDMYTAELGLPALVVER